MPPTLLFSFGAVPMNLRDQQLFLELFHSACLAITQRKGPDYAPDGIPLLDMVATCVDANISIPQGLWTLYRKHVSAIRKHFILRQPLTSEPIEERLYDAANYLGFLAFYDANKHELFVAWRRHWVEQPCECESGNIDPLTNARQLCHRCETLFWLDRQASNEGFDLTWWASIRKAPDWSRTGRPNTGDTIPPPHSRSRSATKTDEKLGYVGKSIPELGALSQDLNENKKR